MTPTNRYFSLQPQNGFGVVGFLVLLPLLISVLATIAGAALVLKADAHLKHECRTSVLQSQRAVAEKLRKLIALNPEAEEVREEYEAAKEALQMAEASADPAAVTFAQAQLLAATLHKNVVRARQQLLITQSKIENMRAPIRAKSAVDKSAAEEASLSGLAPPRSRPAFKFASFDLVATPEGDSTPDYKPSPRFTAKQTVDVDVRVDVSSLLPEWLRDLLPNRQLEINSRCQATIEQKENTWVETLNAVR